MWCWVAAVPTTMVSAVTTIPDALAQDLVLNPKSQIDAQNNDYLLQMRSNVQSQKALAQERLARMQVHAKTSETARHLRALKTVLPNRQPVAGEQRLRRRGWREEVDRPLPPKGGALQALPAAQDVDGRRQQAHAKELALARVTDFGAGTSKFKTGDLAEGTDEWASGRQAGLRYPVLAREQFTFIQGDDPIEPAFSGIGRAPEQHAPFWADTAASGRERKSDGLEVDYTAPPCTTALQQRPSGSLAVQPSLVLRSDGTALPLPPGQQAQFEQTRPAERSRLQHSLRADDAAPAHTVVKPSFSLHAQRSDAAPANTVHFHRSDAALLQDPLTAGAPADRSLVFQQSQAQPRAQLRTSMRNEQLAEKLLSEALGATGRRLDTSGQERAPQAQATRPVRDTVNTASLQLTAGAGQRAAAAHPGEGRAVLGAMEASLLHKHETMQLPLHTGLGGHSTLPSGPAAVPLWTPQGAAAVLPQRELLPGPEAQGPLLSRGQQVAFLHKAGVQADTLARDLTALQLQQQQQQPLPPSAAAAAAAAAAAPGLRSAPEAAPQVDLMGRAQKVRPAGERAYRAAEGDPMMFKR